MTSPSMHPARMLALGFAALAFASTAAGAAPITGIGTGGTLLESPAGFGIVPSLSMPAVTPPQITQQISLAAGAGLKIFVDREGWFRVTKSEMLAAGFDPGSDPKVLSLFCGGAEQAIVVDDGGDRRFDATDAIEFFGQRLETASTGARTYWLQAGKGSGARVKTASGKGSTPFTGSVAFTDELRERDWYNPDVTTNGDEQNWYGPIVISDPTFATLNVGNFDPSWPGNATLEVTIQGGTPNSRSFGVSINGHDLGLNTLNGFEAKSFTWAFPQSWLQYGPNQLVLQSTGDWTDASGIVVTRLTYRHLLRADGGAFQAQLPGGSPVSVGGFTEATVRAFDLTDAQRPVEIPVAVAPETGGSFAAAFTPVAGASRRVLLVQRSRFEVVPELAVNQPSSWSTQKGGAEFVIVTHGSFSASAASLAALRRSEGLSTIVVDVDDLYDEFNFGIRTPDAIRSFLQAASRWKTVPRYLLLVGDASTDARNSYGFGSNDYLPAKLIATGYGKAASDDWFADLDGNGTPDLSVGRIPVRTAADADLVIGRIVSRGTPSGAWSTSALFVSDVTGEYDFRGMTNQVAPLVPATWSTHYADADGSANPRADIAAAINEGHAVVNYFGHGSVTLWGLDYFAPTFNGDDATALTNGTQLPFLASMECLNGSFNDAYQTSMAENFLTAPNGGAIAVFASSTLTFPAPQQVLDAELFRLLFSGSSPRLGDACRLAKLPVTDADVRNSWMLFGDPTMKLR